MQRHRQKQRSRCLICAILYVCLWLWPGLPAVVADEFFLKSGQRVEGRLLNPDERPRQTYEISLKKGGKTSLAVDEVARFVPDSPAKRHYLELLPRMPNTADGNWRMAGWCRRNALPSEYNFHLEETVLLDPEHEQAHRALGHTLVNGQWVARDEVMLARGFVRYKGRWELPQEVEIDQRRERAARVRNSDHIDMRVVHSPLKSSVVRRHRGRRHQGLFG